MSDPTDKHHLTGEQSKRYGKAKDNYDRLIADPEYRKEQKENRTVTQIKKIRAGLEERLTRAGEDETSPPPPNEKLAASNKKPTKPSKK